MSNSVKEKLAALKKAKSKPLTPEVDQPQPETTQAVALNSEGKEDLASAGAPGEIRLDVPVGESKVVTIRLQIQIDA